MIGFFKEHKGIVGYGMLLTFFSGFGQTYLISLFVPYFNSSFDLSIAAFGSLYGAVTIGSAFAIIYLGKLADHYPIQKYTVFVVLLLASSLAITAFSINLAMLFVGLWGMRLAGQGLMPHTSATAMSRYFGKERGKALSISTLGHPVGEAVLPILITLLITLFDWRITLALAAFLLLVAILPYVFVIADFSKYHQPTDQNSVEEKKWTQGKVLKSREFFLLAPSSFIVTFLTTALFLYQIPLAESKGWEPQWMAFCISGFALARIFSILVAGILVDKFGAKNLFPLYLLPYIAGLLILMSFSGQWAAYAYMFLAGATVGLGGTIKSALQAEIFGVASIGSVRSLFSTLVIFSTALGPILFGLLIDAGLTFNNLIGISILLLVLTVLWSFRLGSSYTLKHISAN